MFENEGASEEAIEGEGEWVSFGPDEVEDEEILGDAGAGDWELSGSCADVARVKWAMFGKIMRSTLKRRPLEALISVASSTTMR